MVSEYDLPQAANGRCVLQIMGWPTDETHFFADRCCRAGVRAPETCGQENLGWELVLFRHRLRRDSYRAAPDGKFYHGAPVCRGTPSTGRGGWGLQRRRHPRARRGELWELS